MITYHSGREGTRGVQTIHRPSRYHSRLGTTMSRRTVEGLDTWIENDSEDA